MKILSTVSEAFIWLITNSLLLVANIYSGIGCMIGFFFQSLCLVMIGCKISDGEKHKNWPRSLTPHEDFRILPWHILLFTIALTFFFNQTIAALICKYLVYSACLYILLFFSLFLLHVIADNLGHPLMTDASDDDGGCSCKGCVLPD